MGGQLTPRRVIRDRSRASDAGWSLQTGGWNSYRLLHELPDREHDAEDQKGADQGFEQTSVFFFRADQKGVGGFVVFHKVLLVDTNPYAASVPPPRL
jgi:hypothetical protein